MAGTPDEAEAAASASAAGRPPVARVVERVALAELAGARLLVRLAYIHQSSREPEQPPYREPELERHFETVEKEFSAEERRHLH